MSLERIEITPFAVIAGDILQNRGSGALTIVRPPLRRVLYWSQGELVMAASAAPEDSLGHFLVQRGVITSAHALELFSGNTLSDVEKLHESGMLDLSARQTLLREWLAGQFLPLFSLDEGTAAFTDDEPLPPEKRVFVPSTAALIIEGVRSITNGLVLRRSLGDLKREIEPARESRFHIESLPLSDPEREIASALTERITVDAFLKRFPASSVGAAKVVIAMLALGVYENAQERHAPQSGELDDMQRDLELMAAIGSNDPRSLRLIAFSKQLPSLDHYQVLDIPRAATRAQAINAADAAHQRFDVVGYPPVLRDTLNVIHRRIDEAIEVLKDPGRRASYDKLLTTRGRGGASIHQRMTQQMIAQQNVIKSKDLIAHNDYYGAIVLLRQSVHFMPENSEAWTLLGSCQERNPKWRRDAAESFQRALANDPNNVDALIALGDLYKLEGLTTRAQTCYEDALKIMPESQQAESRLKALKNR
ncbi:MAG TPA: DUF4388 domain-containing protein [Thermoanaerobaculia bacterium]|nr:DUF4388 domain-containing protein [Thermoanaerobaculia bacterium]